MPTTSPKKPPVEAEPVELPPAQRFTLLNVSGIALIAFMAGLYIGSAFLGQSAPPPTPPMSGLPAGHPNVDPNNPIPAPPLSSLPTPGTPTEPTATATSGSNLAPPPEAKPEEGGYDLTYDDAGVRAAIQHASDYQALVHIGNEQFDAKHPRLAIAAYEKALKIHPFDPDVQTDLGVMYRATHRPSDAIKAFRNAASLDPKHAQSRYNLGVVLAFDANDMKGAIAAWKDYLRVAPPGPQAEDVKRQVEAMEKQVGKS